MIHLKTKKEIEIMKKGGEILSTVMQLLLSSVKTGVTLLELDAMAEKEIKKHGASPSFHHVPGYKWALCTCVNDVVVHGVPTTYAIRPGDVVGIDCGVYFEGFHTDSAWTVRVPSSSSSRDDVEDFLQTSEKALHAGLAQVKPGNRIYDISHAVQQEVEGKGYSIVRTLVGHGVGRELHEEPEVPNYVTKRRDKTPELVPGMTLAVEVISTMGDPDVIYTGNDGWTISTKDATLSALFEATVALNDHGFLLLTKLYGSSGDY